MNKVTSFNRDTANHCDLVRLHDSGYKVICPLCKSELIFKKSGIWCPENANHYSVYNYPADIARRFRESSKQRGIEKTIKALKAKGFTQPQIDAEISKLYPESEYSFELIKFPQKNTGAMGGYKKKKRSQRIVTVKGYKYMSPDKPRSTRKKSKT